MKEKTLSARVDVSTREVVALAARLKGMTLSQFVAEAADSQARLFLAEESRTRVLGAGEGTVQRPEASVDQPG